MPTTLQTIHQPPETGFHPGAKPFLRSNQFDPQPTRFDHTLDVAESLADRAASAESGNFSAESIPNDDQQTQATAVRPENPPDPESTTHDQVRANDEDPSNSVAPPVVGIPHDLTELDQIDIDDAFQLTDLLPTIDPLLNHADSQPVADVQGQTSSALPVLNGVDSTRQESIHITRASIENAGVLSETARTDGTQIIDGVVSEEITSSEKQSNANVSAITPDVAPRHREPSLSVGHAAAAPLPAESSVPLIVRDGSVKTDITSQTQSTTKDEHPITPNVTTNTTADEFKNSGRDAQQQARQPVLQVSMENQSTTSPALTRAAQVNAAVMLENTTGQGTTTMPLHGAFSSTASPASLGQTITLNEQSIIPGFESQATEKMFDQRIVRGMSALINSRGGVMNMRLDPPQLGQLRVQLSIVQATVQASFRVTTDQAMHLLQQNLNVLRSALEQQGLTVERLTVQVQSNPSSPGATAHNQPDQQETTRQQNHDAAGHQSRGRGQQQQHASNHSLPESLKPWFDEHYQDVTTTQHAISAES